MCCCSKGLRLPLTVLSVRTNAPLVQFPVLNSILWSKASLCWGELHLSTAVFLVLLPPLLPRLLENQEILLLKGCMTQVAISPGCASCDNSHNQNYTNLPTSTQRSRIKPTTFESLERSPHRRRHGHHKLIWVMAGLQHRTQPSTSFWMLLVKWNF